MRLDNVRTLTLGRYPLRLMSYPPRIFGPLDDNGPLTRTILDDTWELTVRQLRYRPADWPHLDWPHGTVSGWFFEVGQSGPPPTRNGASRLFLTDLRLDDMNRDNSWVLLPDVGPLQGHIEIHAPNHQGAWLLRYPTVNGGEPVRLAPQLATWRHPQDTW